MTEHINRNTKRLKLISGLILFGMLFLYFGRSWFSISLDEKEMQDVAHQYAEKIIRERGAAGKAILLECVLSEPQSEERTVAVSKVAICNSQEPKNRVTVEIALTASGSVVYWNSSELQ